MLNSLLILLALHTFQVTSEEKRTAFVLKNQAQPFQPGSYEYLDLPLEKIVDAPGSGKIYLIIVPAKDIYLSGRYEGLPMVDMKTERGDDLADLILESLENSQDPTTSLDGRTIYERK